LSSTSCSSLIVLTLQKSKKRKRIITSDDEEDEPVAQRSKVCLLLVCFSRFFSVSLRYRLSKRRKRKRFLLLLFLLRLLFLYVHHCRSWTWRRSFRNMIVTWMKSKQLPLHHHPQIKSPFLPFQTLSRSKLCVLFSLRRTSEFTHWQTDSIIQVSTSFTLLKTNYNMELFFIVMSSC
jgi:hypothetical protein